MTETLSQQPSKIGPHRLERLERLLRGDGAHPAPEVFLDYVFSHHGFYRRQDNSTIDVWNIDNQGLLQLYRHSQRNYRQTFVRQIVLTNGPKRKRSDSSERISFVYAPSTAAVENRSALSRSNTQFIRSGKSEFSRSSSSVDAFTPVDSELDVMERVASLAQKMKEENLQSEAAETELREIAEKMVDEIIENSEARLQEFLALVKSEQTRLNENRPPTAMSATSNLVSEMASRSQTRLSDESAQNLAANFLADLTDSVVMHLEDILDQHLAQVVGLDEHKDAADSETSEKSLDSDSPK